MTGGQGDHRAGGQAELGTRQTTGRNVRELRRQRLERYTLERVVGRTMGECQFSGGENQCVEVRSLNLSFWWSSDQWFIALGARSAPVAELGGGFY